MYAYRLLWLLLGIVSGGAQLLQCPPTRFENAYEASTGLITIANYLPATPVNEFALPRRLCVERSGLPVVRRCLANQQWEKLENITCELEQAANEQSQRLNELQFELVEGVSYRGSGLHFSLNIMENMGNIIGQNNHQIQPVDMLNVDKIIDEVAKEPKDVAVCTEMVGLYNNLMATDSSVLELSARLNATNNLLYNFEDYTNALAQQMVAGTNCNQLLANPMPKHLVNVKVHNGVQVLIGGNLSVFYLLPECNQFTGIAIYSEAAAGREGCQDHRFWYRFLYANQSLDALRAEPGLQAATYLTHQLWQAMRSTGVTYLVFKIYANSALFVDASTESAKATPVSHVLSINIPQSSKNLAHPLVFLLRNEKYENANRSTNQIDDYCGYWNYDTWKTNGITTNTTSLPYDPIVVCYTDHLTQFAFLVGASCNQQNCPYDEDPEEAKRSESLLDVTTAFGCGLSLFGLLGIWLTAAISRKWRSMRSTKLLLNMCLALSLLFGLMLLLYVNEWFWRYSFDQSRSACIALGALFQYSVLLLFSWMLLIGYLQYQRHVTVLVARPEHIVLRVAVIAWLLPLLPTLLLVFISPAAYSPVKSGDIASVCYPSGSGLVYGVLLPIGLVLIANVFTFVCIFYRVTRLEDRNGQLIWMQLRLFVLLFFLLGLTWIFGICAYFRLGLVVTFIFCILATLQGFVLFLYFVLFDKVARSAWLQFLLRKQETASIQLTG
ncbi:adhesion G-protein coupled receptor G2-like [Drosophila montana]|uniref:adhesion G-protein coupled receptor G2-like n=1 Tax=Drosophila montana TaxID=40370 RepID=UPI00313D890F